MIFTLDASAVLAVLFNEPGGDFVYDIIAGSEISVINLSEVYATLLDYGMTYEEADELVVALPMRIRSFRDDHARETAKLRPLTKSLGLSLGDRACLAQSIFNMRPILTADRRMAEANGLLGIDIRMIR